MSLRILQVVFSSRIAGSERYCIDLANCQASAGHEVHVAGMRDSPVAGELDPRVHFHGFTLPLFRRWTLRRLIRRIGVDVAHGHLSAACKALAGCGDLCATAGTLHVGYKPHQHSALDALVCVNHAQLTRLNEYRGMARVISNWLPTSVSPVTAANLRQSLGLKAATKLVGAVGRLHPSKGMDVLVRAFRAGAPADSALVLIGDGPQRDDLGRLAAGDPRIHFVGYRADVSACLAELDLFVSPSREESFGLAILEAMNARLPLIATAAEGPAEYLRQQPVRLVPPGEVEPLSLVLAKSLDALPGGGVYRQAYDLRAFSPIDRVANIGELYGHVLKAKAAAGRQTAGAVVAT